MSLVWYHSEGEISNMWYYNKTVSKSSLEETSYILGLSFLKVIIIIMKIIIIMISYSLKLWVWTGWVSFTDSLIMFDYQTLCQPYFL